jgi:oxaloacetate decarboxylase alpha subunit
MATPMSQFVGIQAVLNVVTGDPYSLSPDEVIHYLLGHYGPIYGPVNQEVKDRILSTPRAREIMKWERPDPTIGEIRSKFAPGISDEELLLRFLLSQEAVDQALGNGPVRKDPRRSSNAIVENVLDLVSESRPSTGFSVRSPEFSVELRRAR